MRLYFFFFFRKQVLTFHANCPKPCFLEKNKKKHISSCRLLKYATERGILYMGLARSRLPMTYAIGFITGKHISIRLEH